MRATVLALVSFPLLVLAVPTVHADAALVPEDARQAYDTITGDRVLATIRFLASAGLEGREAGERGSDIAADYIVSRFQAAGLRPASKEGFVQRFDLLRRTLDDDVVLTLARISGDARETRTMKLESEWIPLDFSEVGTVEAPVVFGGYGIVAPEYDWDDYAALGKGGARGKIVVVFRHEPDEEGVAGSEFFEGREMTLHASLRQKAREAAERGALGLIVVDDPGHYDPDAAPSSSLAAWFPRDPNEEARVRPAVEGQASPLGVHAALASQRLLRWLDRGADWDAIRDRMDSSRKPWARAYPDVTARIVHGFEVTRTPTRNVLAVLPGSDPSLADEYVVIGGHYDHEGKDEDSGEIYRGADDNASGTAAVLAVAEAFASLPQPPARSVLFAAWGAEEKGLLGSEAFVRDPVVPLDRIVAGINLDMIGRNKEDKISIVGRPETPDLVELFDRYAETVGLALSDDAGAGASRSDNGSLWLAGIPTTSLFSGTHEDYHEPGDTADKILPGKVERAARLTFLVAHEIASGSATPARLDVPRGPWDSLAPPANPPSEDGR